MITQLNNEVGLPRFIRENVFLRRLMITIWHFMGLCLSYYLAYILRFDGVIPDEQWVNFWGTLPLLVAIYLITFGIFNLYSGMWAYFSLDDLARMMAALFCATNFFGISVLVFRGWSLEGFPRSLFMLEFMLMGGWMGGSRFLIRYYRIQKNLYTENDEHQDRILIAGGLEEADLLIRGTRSSDIGKVVAIITDEEKNFGMRIHGVRIMGGVDSVASIARETKATCIVILPPFNRPKDIDRIVANCADAKVSCSFRTIPSMADLASGSLTASSIKQVDIEDLMRRQATRLDRTEVRAFIKNKKVMITGAGGSIGQELCRQIAGYEPSKLLLFESSEYSLYTIDRQLKAAYPNLTVISVAGDIRHPEEVRNAIDQADGIDIIYHAAAYKHVPLMEMNVPASFRTNVLGTARLADVAVEKKIDRFVMISSDKAVRPTSVMGVTKRLAERVIAERNSNGTTFVSVRFGNVLESSGSVIPLFKEQIANGGPVTVTSPDMRRFFMTVSEAVDLVLMAGTVGRNGEIMVLEMGESIRVVDLAKRLIELSGLVPEEDIQIEYIGMRPGEKEYEEIMTEDEDVVQTSHEKIWVFKKKDKEIDSHENSRKVTKKDKVDLERVRELVEKNDGQGLRELAKQYIPENMLDNS